MNSADSVRTLIVDDEPLARRGVRVRLERMIGFQVVAECASGRAAISAIAELTPDLVLLDVQMPGVDGFGVVDALGAARMPATIFITAFDRHALRAFDANAIDYLLKPIDDERFVLALSRARQRLEEKRSGALAAKLSAALADARGSHARIAVHDRGRMLLIDEGDVDWVGAEGDYVRVYAGGRGHLLRDTMTAMESRLDPTRFARIHRSTIVNVSRIRALRPQGDREYVVTLRDGTMLRLSRGYRERLRALMGDVV